MDIEKFISENTNLGGSVVAVTYSKERLIELLKRYEEKSVIRISNKEIDVFFNDTMYTDLTNYYGIIQKTDKGNYSKWKSPTQFIKDFIKWKNNNVKKIIL